MMLSDTFYKKARWNLLLTWTLVLAVFGVSGMLNLDAIKLVFTDISHMFVFESVGAQVAMMLVFAAGILVLMVLPIWMSARHGLDRKYDGDFLSILFLVLSTALAAWLCNDVTASWQMGAAVTLVLAAFYGIGSQL